MQSAILLAAFGSLQPSALATYENIKAFYWREFPNSEVRIAFTSGFIRQKLRDQNILIPNLLTALAELQDRGFRDIIVQPLQIVPGKEFHELASLVRCLGGIQGRHGFHSLALGLPLLTSTEDIEKTTDALKPVFEVINEQKMRKYRNGTAIVLVGHGTNHPADSIYSQMNMMLASRYKNVILGTLEGYPGIGDVLSWLTKNKIKNVVIMPFLLVSGGHALDDIAGDKESSWRTILERNGFDVEAHLKGLGDEEGIIKLYLEHTSDVIKNTSCGMAANKDRHDVLI